MSLFTQEQSDFIKKNANGRNDQSMCDLVNERFGLSIKRIQMKNWRGNNNARSDTSLYGWKKGKKAGVDFTPQKEFKNSSPIGSESLSKGNVIIKTAPGTWVPKHRYLWEQSNGPLPDKHVVIFADGDNRNFELSNLLLIKRKHLAILNKKRLLVGDEQLRRTAIHYSKLIEKISELDKRGARK